LTPPRDHATAIKKIRAAPDEAARLRGAQAAAAAIAIREHVVMRRASAVMLSAARADGAPYAAMPLLTRHAAKLLRLSRRYAGAVTALLRSAAWRKIQSFFSRFSRHHTLRRGCHCCCCH